MSLNKKMTSKIKKICHIGIGNKYHVFTTVSQYCGQEAQQQMFLYLNLLIFYFIAKKIHLIAGTMCKRGFSQSLGLRTQMVAQVWRNRIRDLLHF
jgi:hypothetical protein